MKVILRENVKGQGNAGDVIEVKKGFARNYLFPQGLAFEATESNMKVYQREQQSKLKMAELTRSENEKMKVELEKISLTSAVKVGEDGRLFGSVTSHTISELLKEQGYDINHRKINIDEPIKELGVYEVGVDLGHEIEARIKIWVVSETK